MATLGEGELKGRDGERQYQQKYKGICSRSLWLGDIKKGGSLSFNNESERKTKSKGNREDELGLDIV